MERNIGYRIISIRGISEDDYRHTLSLMTPGRRERVTRLRRENDRRLTVAGDWLARRMIGEKCGIPEDSVAFERTGRGKPFAVGLPVEFSISHSGEMVLCALSDNPVGADIEKIRPVKERLIRRVCDDREFSFVTEKGISDEEKYRRFFRVWTGKEAYFKCLGTGIVSDLRKVCIFEGEISGGTVFFTQGEYAVSIYSI